MLCNVSTKTLGEKFADVGQSDKPVNDLERGAELDGGAIPPTSTK